MFGVLLESRARGMRRTGGAALSVAVHLSIIGGVAAATVHGDPAPPEPTKAVIVHFSKPPAASPVQRRPVPASSATSAHATIAPSVDVVIIPPPMYTPSELPAPDMSHGASLDSLLIASAPSGGRGGLPIGGLDVRAENGTTTELRGAELLMRIISSAKPRYPESLRQAGIGGRVLIRFTVDTLCKIDMGAVQVLQSTHDLFLRSVRDVLPSYRFKPTERGGKCLLALAEMPFEFQVTR